MPIIAHATIRTLALLNGPTLARSPHMGDNATRVREMWEADAAQPMKLQRQVPEIREGFRWRRRKHFKALSPSGVDASDATFHRRKRRARHGGGGID